MEKNKNVKEITIKIEGKEWQDALDKLLKKQIKKLKLMDLDKEKLQKKYL